MSYYIAYNIQDLKALIGREVGLICRDFVESNLSNARVSNDNSMIVLEIDKRSFEKLTYKEKLRAAVKTADEMRAYLSDGDNWKSEDDGRFNG